MFKGKRQKEAMMLLAVLVTALWACTDYDEHTILLPRYGDLRVTGIKSEWMGEKVKITWNKGVYDYGYVVFRADYRQASFPEDKEFEYHALVKDTFFIEKLGLFSNRYYYKVALYSPDCSCTGPLSDAVRSLNLEPTKVDTGIKELADSTNGSHYQVNSSGEVPEAIKELIVKEVKDSSDLVFLIDDTGSMSDDILAVKQELNEIIKKLPRWVRLGAATYNDNNTTDKWYRCTGLTSNYKKVDEFLKTVDAWGGGDYPESVYDGVVATIDTMEWKNPNRFIFVIGDAPALEGDKTKNSKGAMLEKCRNHDITLHTILIN
jgi:hypothetical protein